MIFHQKVMKNGVFAQQPAIDLTNSKTILLKKTIGREDAADKKVCTASAVRKDDTLTYLTYTLAARNCIILIIIGIHH